MSKHIAIVRGTHPDTSHNIMDARRLAEATNSAYTVFAVNAAGLYQEGSFIWCSLHAEYMQNWRRLRSYKLGYDYRIVTPETYPGARECDLNINEKWLGCSSGLYAAQIAVDVFGFDKVILCGVHLNKEGNDADFANQYGAYQDNLWQPLAECPNKIRSMGGATRELFGAPSVDWVLS